MTHQAVFAALSDPMRLHIVETLLRSPASVAELAAGLPISRPAVSQHLKVLKNARLVKDVAAGNKRIYEIEAGGFTALREWLDPFWDDALSSFQVEMHRRHAKRKKQ
jgi:DNA-binding transcriptional ArsR family regulator